MGSAAGTILLTIVTFFAKLFRLDKFTHMASVELWVLLTTLLLVIRFLLDFYGPWYANRSMTGIIIALEMLNSNLVVYTMGLMQLWPAWLKLLQPPSPAPRGPLLQLSPAPAPAPAPMNDYFQAWAVLLVTLQYSVNIGRPYSRSKQTPLLDLMSSFWSANLLRVQTFFPLRIPLWLIWSLNAARIVLLFTISSKADTINQESMRLVSDYMSYEDTLSADAAGAGKKEFTMSDYKYLVHGEHLVLKEVQEGPQEGRTLASCFRKRRRITSTEPGQSYKIRLDPGQEHKKQLVTLDRISNFDAVENGLLSKTTDAGNRLQDVCLSFALYKLLRRRFFDLPIHERARPRGQEKISRLVFDYILQEDTKKNYERAFRITEVELSFLQDLFYSKQAAMFAGGFEVPVVSLLLSLSLVAATGYIMYPVCYIPGRMDRMDPKDADGTTHGVSITRLIAILIIAKELAEIYMYVFSQWTKVTMLCKYVNHRCLQHPLAEKVMRLMFRFSRRGKWSQRIRQHNLLVSSRVVTVKLKKTSRPHYLHLQSKIPGRIDLTDYTKNAILESLKSLQEDPQRLGSYFANAFGSKQQLAWARDELKVDTHRILLWHIATCLCEIHLSDEVRALKAFWLQSRPFVREESDKPVWWDYYNTAASLSNYCAYLVSQALVPDNGLVAWKVFGEVCREIHGVASNFRVTFTSLLRPGVKLGSMKDAYDCLMETVDKYREQGGESDPDVEAPEGDGAVDQEEGESELEGGEPDPDEEAPEGDGAVDQEEGEPELDDDLDIGNSLTRMGAKLAKQLIEQAYNDDTAGLWRDLAGFWTGFLLHLAASTKASKHKTHLAGSGELITHLWALLSHAGFLGSVSHGQQDLDPEDGEGVDPPS